MSFSPTNHNNKKVYQWLKDLFQEDEIPPFEESEELMEILLKIMHKNQEAEKDALEIIKTEKKHTQIYEEKTDKLQSLLDGESLALSSETVKRIESLAALGNKLNLKEPTLTNFLLAIHEAENKEMENKEKEMINDHHLTTLSKKVTKIMKTNEMLRRDLKMLEKTIELQEEYKPKVEKKSSFLNVKIEEYKYRIKKFERDLDKRNYDPSQQHHRLIQRSESVKELEKNVQNLKSKLDSFQSLPPNESLTRQRIQAAKDELRTLQEEFSVMLAASEGASISENSDNC